MSVKIQPQPDFLPENLLTELRERTAECLGRPPLRFMDVDPRTMLKLLDEIERHRETLLIVERREHDPALRD